MTAVYAMDKLTEEEVGYLLEQIKGGAVFAFPTDTVYGIGTNAFNENSIERLYQIKQRPSKMALQILVDSVQTAKIFCQWNPYAERLARAFWPGPLTMILPPTQAGKVLLRGFKGLGLRVPRHEGLARMLKQVPLASTSANLHGEPVITKEEELIRFVEGKVDFILTGGTLSAQASCVVDFVRKDGKSQESIWQKVRQLFSCTSDLPVLVRQGSVSRTELEKVLKYPLK